MTTIMIATPPTLFEFLATDEQQIFVSLAKGREELTVISKLEGLYGAALSFDVVEESESAIFQLLTLTHYHFLFATACHLRCHFSESFASARVAIDAALLASHIIKDRTSQSAYLNRQPPFDNFMRHVGQLIKNKMPLPHPLVPLLVKQYKICSSFASHADHLTFMHRIQTTKFDGKITEMGVDYFQFAKNDSERRLHAFALFYTFTLTLDIFADYLVLQKKAVPEKWRAELHGLNKAIQMRSDALRAEASTKRPESPTGPR
jgi:hypothetical protein